MWARTGGCGSGSGSSLSAVPHKADSEGYRELVLARATAGPVTLDVTQPNGTEKVSHSLDNKQRGRQEGFSTSARKRSSSSVTSSSAHSIINRFGLSHLNLAWYLAFAVGTIEAVRATPRGLRLLRMFFVFLKT
jgi:hypothetical protein